MNASALLNNMPPAASGKAELRGELSAKQPSWLTEAVASVLHAERGTVKQVAWALGVPERQVYEAGDRYNPRPLKAWWLPTICQVTNNYALLDALERKVARVAFPLITESCGDAMQQALAREVTAFGEFLAETAADLADGRIDGDELKRLLPAIDSIIARTCEYRAMVVAKAKADEAA